MIIKRLNLLFQYFHFQLNKQKTGKVIIIKLNNRDKFIVSFSLKYLYTKIKIKISHVKKKYLKSCSSPKNNSGIKII